ncbi:MAG: sigma-54 dependent transcriptional regulator [Bdellovibrionales bacterium]|nr:sigma-54 dependent transcriptional regulator [Bdellovibrionales bacterium]
MYKILIVDDDPGLRLSVRTTLSAHPSRFSIEEAMDGLDAMEKIKNSGGFRLVILDVDMPRLSGLETLRLIKEYDPSIIVVIMTAYANIDDAVRSVKEGAFDYLAKPVRADDLFTLVDKALTAYSLISDVAGSAPVLMDAGREIIGNTVQMRKVFNIILRLSKVDTPVLIRGASGTGKELVARAIHANSSRKDGRFVAINCSAIPENLFESELFGHEKGAFTGADQRKIGKFQFAENGTLFLDELGDLPVMMQVKLLRVLQEKCFTPVGANREIDSHVRIIGATNRNLEEMIKMATFREDLYYRLNVMPIFLPSLKDRKEDLTHLVTRFVKKFNQSHNKKIIGVAPEALALIKKYDWPGNIRELENVIEHAFILEESNQLTLQSLPENFLRELGVDISSDMDTVKSTTSSINALDQPLYVGDDKIDEDDLLESDFEDTTNPLKTGDDSLDFNKQKELFEKDFIIKALKTFKGRINQTALHANIPKKTLLRKIEKYGLNAKDYA